GTASLWGRAGGGGLGVAGGGAFCGRGALLYEMVTGRLPFVGETPSHIIVAILEQEPPPLASYWSGASTELQRIVSKALSKDKAARYQTAKDLLIDLKRLKQDLELEAKLEPSQQPGSGGRGRFRTSAAVPAARSQPRWWANRLVWLSIAVIL